MIATASALAVYGRCRVPAHVMQRMSAVLGTMLSQRWRARAPLQGKKGSAAQYLTRNQAIKKLQLRLAEFRCTVDRCVLSHPPQADACRQPPGLVGMGLHL